jgi:hypothetical protein
VVRQAAGISSALEGIAEDRAAAYARAGIGIGR